MDLPYQEGTTQAGHLYILVGPAIFEVSKAFL